MVVTEPLAESDKEAEPLPLMDGESVAQEEAETVASNDTEAFAEFDRLLEAVVEAEL